MSIKFKQIRRDKLFYGAWRYCVSGTLEEANCARSLTHSSVDSHVHRRNYHRRLWAQGRDFEPIPQTTVDNLHSFVSAMTSLTSPFRPMVGWDTVRVYTDDPKVCEVIGALGFIGDVKFTEAVNCLPGGCVIRKNSPFAFRTYLKQREFTREEKESFVSFLKNQSDISLSPRLLWWASWGGRWTLRSHFIDHQDEYLNITLELIAPGITRPSLPIVKS